MSYIDPSDDTGARRAALAQRFLFNCSCATCAGPAPEGPAPEGPAPAEPRDAALAAARCGLRCPAARCPGALEGWSAREWEYYRAVVDAPPPPSLPYKVDTSRPSLRTNWTRLVPFPQVDARAPNPLRPAQRDVFAAGLSSESEPEDGAAEAPPPPPPPY